MKQPHKHTEAANFLINHALPSEAEIDAMGPKELAEFLSANGADVAKLSKNISALKTQLSGKLALANARKSRLAKKERCQEADLSAMSEQDFIQALKNKYGSIEQMPLAARNHKSMNRDDWESLFRDLVLGEQD